MRLQTEIIYVNSIIDLPTKEEIDSLSREVKLIVIFNEDTENKHEKIFKKWKCDFPDFLIWNHSQFSFKKHILIPKLITTDEITINQDFFEQ